MNSTSDGGAAFDSPKLRTQTDVLERRLDELTTTLENAIADIEAGALDPRLSSWLAWFSRRRHAPIVTLAVAGTRLRDRTAELGERSVETLDARDIAIAGASAELASDYPNASVVSTTKLPASVGIIALLDMTNVLADAFALGGLRRDCAGLLWLGEGHLVPTDVADLFRESPLGIIVRPQADATLAGALTYLFPEGATQPVAALSHARTLLDLAAGCQAEHGRENARLALQALIAERAKGSRAFSDELAARRELMAQVRDELSRDLQGSVDNLVRSAAQLDADLVLRGPVKRAMEEIPALSVAPGKLVHVSDFEEEDRYHWWTGTPWEKLDPLFPRKLRLSIRSADLAALSAGLSAQLTAIVSKQALRVVDGFNASVHDFADVASSVGVNLATAEIAQEERAHWDRKADAASFAGGLASSTFGADGPPLKDRSKRLLDTTCERDMKTFHVDIERRGPMGRIMEARTAVMGLSFLVMTTIRVSGAWGAIEKWMTASAHPQNAPAAAVGAAHGGVPWNLIFNAALIGVFFIFLGLVVNAITESGKEGAQLSEKVHEARDALEDKLVAVMERFVAKELGDLKTVVTEHKALGLERLERAIDAQKQVIDEVDRKNRAASTSMRTTRTGLAALPLGLRADVDKTALAAKDVRTELAARYAALAAPPSPAVAAAPNRFAPAASGAPAQPAPVAPAADARPDTSGAIAALQARAAARAAAAAKPAAESG